VSRRTAPNVKREGPGNPKATARVSDPAPPNDRRGAARDGLLTVITPPTEPSRGIHPVGSALLPQRASPSASSVTPAAVIAVLEGAMIPTSSDGLQSPPGILKDDSESLA